MPKQRKIKGYDGPSGAYVATGGKFLPLSEPEAVSYTHLTLPTIYSV